LPTALAAPVPLGMMLKPAPRPPRQSFIEGPSTVFCVAVTACTWCQSRYELKREGGHARTVAKRAAEERVTETSAAETRANAVAP
jgi:hypothetical protein